MRRNSLQLWLAFLSVSLCFCALPALAKNSAEIKNIEVNRDSKNLKVSFHVENCFTLEMEEAIWSGVSTTFRYIVVLEEPGFLFLDSGLLDVVLEHSIKYDHLKEEFRVSLPETFEKERVTTHFREAQRWMSEVEDLPLIPLWRLEKGHQYQLSLKAELSKVRLPFLLRYILFFVSLWDFETDWYTMTFTF